MNISAGLTKVLAKGAGIAGLGAIAYDAHQYGKIQAQTYSKNQMAESAKDAYMSGTTSDSTSTIASKLQKFRLDGELNNKFFGRTRNFLSSAKGYIKGIGTSLAENVIPLALSAGALITKGKASAVFGAATAIFGGIKVAGATFGIGKTNYLKK